MEKKFSKEFSLLAWAAGQLQHSCGTLSKHLTKPLTQVVASPSSLRLFLPDKSQTRPQHGHKRRNLPMDMFLHTCRRTRHLSLSL